MGAAESLISAYARLANIGADSGTRCLGKESSITIVLSLLRGSRCLHRGSMRGEELTARIEDHLRVLLGIAEATV